MPAVKAEFFPCQTTAAHRIVAHGGNRPDIQFGRFERQGERQGVIDIAADVGVEDDGDGLLAVSDHRIQ
jgi:hypothetical protein